MANKLIQDLSSGAILVTDLLEHQPIAGPPSLKGTVTALFSDAGGVLAIDRDNRALVDGSANVTVDWQGAALSDGSAVSMFWATRRLLDSTSLLSLNYQSRQLVSSNGATTVLDWASNTQLIANADLLFTDATFDIGKAGATRPRDLFLSRNIVIGGTTNFGGNIISDVLFTDATFDIGKSGATRPRDGFFSRNFVIGGTLGVTGAVTHSSTTVLTGAVLSNLIFTDATFDIGATGATRPRTGYFSESLLIQKSGIGATPADGLQLINSTAAAAGAQQYSTALRLTGRGWKTNATAASRSVDWRIYNQPVQGSSDPNANLLFDFEVDGGGFATAITFSSGGNIITAGNVQIGNGQDIRWTGGSKLKSPTNGVIALLNNAETGFTQLQFGGDTSSFPSLKRSTTILQARLGDDSAFAPLQGMLRTDVNAVTGLTAGVLAATTNASLVVYDASGQAYRIPCII